MVRMINYNKNALNWNRKTKEKINVMKNCSLKISKNENLQQERQIKKRRQKLLIL